MKKKSKKRKLFKFLIILTSIIIIVIYGFTMKVKNIYIKGNKLLSDQEIIELANLTNYPKLYKVSKSNIEKKLKINQYIESVKLHKNIFGKVVIEIKEYKILLKNDLDNTMYLSNLEKVATDNQVVKVPTLINDVDDDILKAFLKKLNLIDEDILEKISEIEYKPNEYDKDLFLFYMNDGNYVYITTTRLNNINKYLEVLEELDGKKGILYLDSGNHFEILS